MSRSPPLLRCDTTVSAFFALGFLALAIGPALAQARGRGPEKLAVLSVVADPDSAVPGISPAVLLTRFGVRATNGLGSSGAAASRTQFVIRWTLEVEANVGALITRRQGTFDVPSLRRSEIEVSVRSEWDATAAGGPVAPGLYALTLHASLVRMKHLPNGRVETSTVDEVITPARTVRVVDRSDQPPQIRISGVSAGECRAAAVVPMISASGAEPISIQATLDGVAFASGASVGTEGHHLLAVDATDARGRSSHAEVPFIIDLTAPAGIWTVVDGTVVADTLLLDVTAFDENLTESTATLDGATITPPIVVHTVGDHMAELRLRDCAGHEVIVRVGFTIDGTAPEIRLDQLQALVNTESLLVTGHYSDDRPGGTLRVSGFPAEISAGGGFQLRIGLFEGVNPIEVAARDFVGHAVAETAEVVRDRTPPTILLEPFGDPFVSVHTTHLRGRVADRIGVASVLVNGTPVVLRGDTLESDVSVAIESGDLEIRVEATDLAGNEQVAVQSRPVFISLHVLAPTPLGGSADFPEGALGPTVTSVAADDLAETELESILELPLTDPSTMVPNEFPPGAFYMPGAIAVTITTSDSTDKTVVRPPRLRVPNLAGGDNSMPLWIFELLPDQDGDSKPEVSLAARAAIRDGFVEALPPESADDPLPGLFAAEHPAFSVTTLARVAPALAARIAARVPNSARFDAAQTVIRIYCCAADAAIPLLTRVQALLRESTCPEPSLQPCRKWYNVQQQVATARNLVADSNAEWINNGKQRLLGEDDGQIDWLRCGSDMFLWATNPQKIAFQTAQIGAELFTSVLKDITDQQFASYAAAITDDVADAISTTASAMQLGGDILSARRESRITDAMRLLSVDARQAGIDRAQLEFLGRLAAENPNEARRRAAETITSLIADRKSRLQRLLSSPRVELVGRAVELIGIHSTCTDGADEIVNALFAWRSLGHAKSELAALETEEIARRRGCEVTLDLLQDFACATGGSPAASRIGGPGLTAASSDPADVLDSQILPAMTASDSLLQSFLADYAILEAQLVAGPDSVLLDESAAIALGRRITSEFSGFVDLWDRFGPDLSNEEVQAAMVDRVHDAEAEQARLMFAADSTDSIVALGPLTSAPQAGVGVRVQNGGFPSLIGISDRSGQAVAVMHTQAQRPGTSQPFTIQGGPVTAHAFLNAPSGSYAGDLIATVPSITFAGANITLTRDLVVDAGVMPLAPSGGLPSAVRWITPGRDTTVASGARLPLAVEVNLPAVDIASVELRYNGGRIDRLMAPPFKTVWDMPPLTPGEITLVADATLADSSHVAAERNLTVIGDTTLPSIVLLQPSGGRALQGGYARVLADVQDASRIASFELQLDGRRIAREAEGPYGAFVRFPAGASTSVLRMEAIDVNGNAAAQAFSVTLDPDPQTIVLGVARDVAGAPLAGATIHVLGARGSEVLGTGVSDIDGSFEVADVATGNPPIRVASWIDSAGSHAARIGVSESAAPVPAGSTEVGTITVQAQIGRLDAPFGFDAEGGRPASGDVNGDGLLDWIRRQTNSGHVEWATRNSAGGFSPGPAIDLPIGNTGSQLVAGDFDLDGDADAVIAYIRSFRPSRIMTLLTRGAAPPETIGTAPPVGRLLSLYTGAFDDDGVPDLLLVGADPLNVVELPGLGGGRFGAPRTVYTPASVSVSAVTDVNRDGLDDLLFVEGPSPNILLFLARPNGAFEPPRPIPVSSRTDLFNVNSVAAGDVTGDAIVDLLLSEDASLILVPGTGSLDFGPAHSIAVPNRARDVYLGDLTDDGIADIVINDNASGQFLKSLGGGSFAAPRLFAFTSSPFNELVDANGDGRLDIASTGKMGAVIAGLGAPGPAIPTLISGFGSASFVTSADLDADADSDLVVADLVGDAIVPIRGDGLGGLLVGTPMAAGDGPVAIAVGDYNRDGAVDMVVADVNGRSVAFLRNEGGNFVQRGSVSLFSSVDDVILSDLTRDGIPDLLYVTGATSGSATVASQRAIGNGFFAQGKTWVTGSQLRSIVSADFDGDGFLDAAVASPGTRSVIVLAGNGTDTLGTPHGFDIEAAPFDLATRDVDGDGRPDLVVAHDSPPGISIYRFQAGGELALVTRAATAVAPTALAMGDVDEDGRLDVVCSIRSSHGLALLRRLEDRSFAEPFYFGAGLNPSSVEFVSLSVSQAPRLLVADRNQIGAAGTLAILDDLKQALPRPPAPKHAARPEHAGRAVIASAARNPELRVSPSPFTAALRIFMSLPTGATGSVRVFDLLGRRVATLASESDGALPSTLTWNGRSDRGDQVRPGIYLVSLRCGELKLTKRVARIR